MVSTVSDETIEEIEQDVFAPIMDVFITLTTPDELTEAIENDWDQAKFLEETKEGQNAVKEIRGFLAPWPMGWVAKAVEDMKKPRLLKWYVNKVLPDKYPEYYVRIVYNPKGLKYLLNTWPKCLDVIF